MAEKTPVTVLTGSPGAGKTTLLNHLLRQPELAHSLVLVTKPGRLGLDHKQVEIWDDGKVLFDTGCPCCSGRSDLPRILREMLPRARRGEIRRVLIEIPGLADPAPILASLTHDQVVASAYRVEGIVSVVDAVNGERQFQTRKAVLQLATADRIIISRVDLADPAPLRERLQLRNPNAAIAEAVHGVVAPMFVLRGSLLRRACRSIDTGGPEDRPVCPQGWWDGRARNR